MPRPSGPTQCSTRQWEVLAETGLTEDEVRSRVRDEVAELIRQGSEDLPPDE